MLAPLLDKMTTHVVSQRFTSDEASTFLTEVIQRLPDTIRHSRVTLAVDFSHLASNTYWQQVPTGFVEIWKEYREPAESCRVEILKRGFRYPLGRRFIFWLRRALCI